MNEQDIETRSERTRPDDPIRRLCDQLRETIETKLRVAVDALVAAGISRDLLWHRVDHADRSDHHVIQVGGNDAFQVVVVYPYDADVVSTGKLEITVDSDWLEGFGPSDAAQS